MKKIIAILLVLAFALGALSLNVLAEPELENFVPENNATFESGEQSWGLLPNDGKLEVVDNPNGEGKVLKYSDIPAKSYATCTLDVREYIQSNIDEETTIYGSVDVYADAARTFLVRLRTATADGFSMCTDAGKNYVTIGNSAGTVAGEWYTILFSFDVTEEDLESKENWNVCFDGINTNDDSGLKTMYLDNFYIGLTEPEVETVEQLPIPERNPITRLDETLIGTIRWDAFTESTPKGTDPASQVARVLSPKEYHCQAPFFANVEADGTVSFPKYTVETWEKEAEYAIAGGLDYYAYLWYESTSAMSEPRKIHLQSAKKDTIKMCGILEAIRGPQTMKELWEAMKDSCYLTLDGRPVLFLYGVNDWTTENVAKLRQDAANVGIDKALYIVGMSVSTNLVQFTTNIGKGIDAISWYSYGSVKTAEPYAELVARLEKDMATIAVLCESNNIDLIPAFSAGRDSRARIQTGVTWVDGDPNAEKDADKPYLNRYALEPSMAELQAHIEKVLTCAMTSKAAKSNLACSYGWNEHEEGGWLCPTLTIDENGNVVKNADGTNKANTERLDALKAAIENVKKSASTTTATPDATAAPDVTATPDATAAPVGKGGGFNVLFVIIPAAVVVIGAAVSVIVIKKKKAE